MGALGLGPRSGADRPGGPPAHDGRAGSPPGTHPHRHILDCDADAITVAVLQDDKGSGRLELRWSPSCQTNWARWQQYPAGWCLNCTPLDLVAVQDTGYSQSLTFSESDGGTPPTGGGTYWTPMIYSPEHAVYAAMHMPGGDATPFKMAMDCALNGLERTDAR